MGSRDSRRVLGPDRSMSYHLLHPPPRQPLLGEDGKRADGRAPHHSRGMFLRVGVVAAAKGSSYMECGRTKVCCAVHGPRDVQRGNDFKMAGQVLCSVRMAPFSCPVRLSSQPDGQQQEMARQLKQTLEAVIVLDRFPKSQVDVHVVVVEADGSVLATALTAACLALAHANIDLYDLAIGCSMILHNNKLFIDPTRKEEEEAQLRGMEGDEGGEGGSSSSQVTVGVMPHHAGGQVAMLVQGGGEAAPPQLSMAVERAMRTCNSVYQLARKALLDHLEETLPSSSSSSS